MESRKDDSTPELPTRKILTSSVLGNKKVVLVCLFVDCYKHGGQVLLFLWEEGKCQIRFLSSYFGSRSSHTYEAL